MAKPDDAAAGSPKSRPIETNTTTTSTSYLITFLVFVIALLLGVLIQQNISIIQGEKELKQTFEDASSMIDVESGRKAETKEPPFDMEEEFRKMSETLKNEIIQAVRNEISSQNKLSSPKPKQDEIVNEPSKPPPKKEEPKVKIELPKYPNQPTKVTIGEEPMVDNKNPEMKFKPGEPIVIQPPIKDEIENKQSIQATKKKQEPQGQGKNEEGSFQSAIISKIKPKKMWIPIPNSNGGHRRVPAIEINAGKPHGSSVKVWVYEEFLSKEECQQLIDVHESYLTSMKKEKPIICFDSVSTLKKHLVELKREKYSELMSEADFTEGTRCLNQTFSRQLEKWGLKWSYSTAFYPGESRFSSIFAKRISEATMLEETHGGKFQITSYPEGVGYKSHTDCTVESGDKHDRYATFLVYLNDMGADGGGQTSFPELGIDVKPREGRALTWNSMNYETGKCEPKSVHEASPVVHPVKKKYIIQRWFYYKNFAGLGKRAKEPELPRRPANTPKVSCDPYDFGSCRMYDEWDWNHVIDYLNRT